MWHVGKFTNINTTLFTALDCNGMEVCVTGVFQLLHRHWLIMTECSKCSTTHPYNCEQHNTDTGLIPVYRVSKESNKAHYPISCKAMRHDIQRKHVNILCLCVCACIQNSAVSQASGTKKKSVQLTWEAPSNSNYGDIYFR